MNSHNNVPDSAVPRLRHPLEWRRVLLSVIIILAGLIVLMDVAFASPISSAFIGAAAVVVGAVEIIYAGWMRRWGGWVWQMMLGLLYILLGLVLVGTTGTSSAVLSTVFGGLARQGELLLTYSLGLLLLLSGIVRVLLGWSSGPKSGWSMPLSGSFGIVAGLIILAEFPKMGLWMFGLLLGIDLIMHGSVWLGFALLRGGEVHRSGDIGGRTPSL